MSRRHRRFGATAHEREFTLETVPTEATSSLWEGTLAPRPDIEPDGGRGGELDVAALEGDLPRASIGLPVVLRALRAVAPEGFEHVERRDFYLVRLWCSLLSFRTDLFFSRARLKITLAGPDADAVAVVAHDLYPSEVMFKTKRNVRFSLSPEIKFMEIGAKLGGVDWAYEYDELQPTIVAGGQGESTPTWDFQSTKGVPLVGGKALHMIVAAPEGTSSASAELELVAHVTKPGRIPLPMGLLDKTGPVPEKTVTARLW